MVRDDGSSKRTMFSWLSGWWFACGRFEREKLIQGNWLICMEEIFGFFPFLFVPAWDIDVMAGTWVVVLWPWNKLEDWIVTLKMMEQKNTRILGLCFLWTFSLTYLHSANRVFFSACTLVSWMMLASEGAPWVHGKWIFWSCFIFLM